MSQAIKTLKPRPLLQSILAHPFFTLPIGNRRDRTDGLSDAVRRDLGLLPIQERADWRRFL